MSGRKRLWVAPAGAGLWSLVAGLWGRCGRVPAGRTGLEAGGGAWVSGPGSQSGCGIAISVVLQRSAKRCCSALRDCQTGERELHCCRGSGMGWPGLRPGRVEKPTLKERGWGAGRSEFLKKTALPSRALRCSRMEWLEWLDWTGGGMVCDGGPLTVGKMPASAPGTLALSELGRSRADFNHAAQQDHRRLRSHYRTPEGTDASV